MSLEEWEAYADQFLRDTGFMRPGKDDARGIHTDAERSAAFTAWWAMRGQLEKLATSRRESFARLTAENARCREALTEIVDQLAAAADGAAMRYRTHDTGYNEGWSDGASSAADDARTIARRAPPVAPRPTPTPARGRGE